MIKWIGAIFVITGCSLVGFSMVSGYKREENLLRQMIAALDYMQCELQYHLTPLPDLCLNAGRQDTGTIGQILILLSQQLEMKAVSDVGICVDAVLAGMSGLPERIRKAFETMGSSLGRFDLEGQIRGLNSVRGYCRRELEEMEKNREMRLRSYQTLGMCAGAALAILFV